MPDRGLIGKTIGNFRIERMLGQGGMGAVYEATDIDLERRVAIKMMHPHLAAQSSFQRRFLQEARTAASLTHRNISRVLSFANVDNELFLVMELAESGNLRQYIKNLHKDGLYIDYPEAIEIIMQLADALDYAHQRGMIHMDVKPDNVVLRSEDNPRSRLNYRPVLTDFGLARLTATGESADTAQPIGTYAYMSPEQCNAERLDTRTDIYSLGIMLFELTVGQLPFKPKSIAEAARMHNQEPLPLPTALWRGFPEELEAIILKSLHKKPTKRYQTAQEMHDALEAIQKPMSFSQSQSTPIVQQAPPPPPDSMSTDLITISMRGQSAEPDMTPPAWTNESHDRLVFYSTTDKPIVATLDDATKTIGRDFAQGIILSGRTVSREHARIERRPSGVYYLYDVGSYNGTFADDEQLEKEAPVIFSSDMTVRLGEYWVKLEIAPENANGAIGGAGKDDAQQRRGGGNNVIVAGGIFDNGDDDSAAPPKTIKSSGEYRAINPDQAVDDAASMGDAPVDEHLKTDSGADDDPADDQQFKPVDDRIDDPVDDPIDEHLKTDPDVDDDAGGIGDADKMGDASDNGTPSTVKASGEYRAVAPDKDTLARQRRDAERVDGSGDDDDDSDEKEDGDEEEDGTPTDYMGEPIPLVIPQYTPPPMNTAELQNGRLVFISEAFQTVRAALTKRVMKIGRSEKSDVKLQGFRLSRNHARVEKDPDGGVYIVDEGTRNGIWLDQNRLKPNERARLTPEATVRMGDYWMKYDAPRDMGFRGPVPQQDSGLLKTVEMVRPLPPEIPPYSAPPMSDEQRAHDRLIFYSEDHPIKYEILEDEEIIIGRDDDADIVLAGKRVSRRHARLFVRRDGLYIEDLDTVNGTWIENTLLVPNTEAIWHQEEIVRLGNYWVKFERGTHQFMPEAGSKDDRRGLVGKTLKSYRIDWLIGHGPVVSVYRATDMDMNRPVALRVLREDMASQEAESRRFLQEARKLQRLEHNNIARLYSYDKADGEVFMVMELINGGTLRQYMNDLSAKNRNIEFIDVIKMGSLMADALHYAHQQKMIHRSLRPENVVLRPTKRIGPLQTYEPVLTDFGLLENETMLDVDDADPNSGQKLSSILPYVSPEYLRDQSIDVRSDIYEMGTILYEMATGRPPFQPRSIVEAVRMHRDSDVPDLARVSNRGEFPQELEKVIRKALEKSPNNRYQTADELSRALQRSVRDLHMDGAISSIPGYQTSFLTEQDEERTKPIPVSKRAPRHMPPLTYAPRVTGRADVDRLMAFSEENRTSFHWMEKDVLTIGRSENSDIFLDSEWVSREHARIERVSEELYRIIDMGSANGTWLGDHKLIPDVAEIWEKDATVRIADYWLRIDRAFDPDAALIPPGWEDEDARDVIDEEEEIVPEVILPPPEHDKIGLVVNESQVRVAPGSSVTLPVEVINKSDRVDHFHVEVNGLPKEWYTQPIVPLNLLPNNRETTSITFHPPMASSSSAGAHAFEVRVSTRAQGINSVARQGALHIEDYHNFVADLAPERLRNRGICELKLSNTGNAYGTYTIQARDREQAVHFELAGKQYTLPPGQSEHIPIRVSPKKRNLLGREQLYNFEINVSADRESLQPQPQSGELVVYPRFRAWMLAIPILMLLVCLGVAAFVAFRNNQTGTANQTATAVALATAAGTPTVQAQVAATETAAADSDGDGLSNAQEEERGTSVNDPDTDGDGLLDGEEVFVWGTDPTLRDTDNDNLSDGEEVNELGTNPLNPDTDGDEIPDNVDENPAMQPTPTITPFPTIPGSEGDICPGSPAPARLAIGMTAFVTEGGVNNRIRDLPGVDVGAVIGEAPPGAEIRVLDGPVCDENGQLRWWQIDFNGTVGWTAEGEGDEYYLRPPGEEAADAGGGDAGGGSGAVNASAGSGGEAPVTAFRIDLDALQLGSVSADGVGIQVQANAMGGAWTTTLSLLEPMDVGWVKFQANWRFLQPDSSAEVSANFAQFRRNVISAKASGYRVLISIAKAPEWSRSVGGLAGPPDNPEDLALFITFMLNSMGDSIDAIEIWNEPNLIAEWTGTLPFDGGGYMALFAPAYEAIRAFSQDIVIVSAGLAPVGNVPGAVDDRLFLDQMFRAGLGNFPDVAIGVHPYGWSNPPEQSCCDPYADRGWDEFRQFFYLNTIEDYYDIASRYMQNPQLWLTEFGWATWSDLPAPPPQEWMMFNTLEAQADYTIRAIRIAQALDFVGPVFLWNLDFADSLAIQERNQIAAYSIFIADSNGNFQPRPLYNRLTNR